MNKKQIHSITSPNLAERQSPIRMLVAIPAAALILSSAAIAQTTYSYTQNAGGAQLWEDAANWSGGSIPDPVAGDTIQANLTMTAATLLDLGANRTFEVWTTSLQGFGSKDFTINSGHTITLAGTTPTITVNGGNGTILRMENAVVGSAGLRKNGSHTLILNNAANSFSGGIELAAGTLEVASDGALGAAGNDMTISGNSTLNLANNMTMARDVLLNSGTTLTFRASVASTISGAVTGTGGIDMNPSGFGSQSVTLSSTANTFTGAIKVGGDATPTLTVNSLADSVNSLDLRVSNKGDTKFIWGDGANSALVLNDRQVILSGNQTRSHVIENANADANNTVTIDKDLSITSTTNRKLVLGGINEGDNTIAGVIPDGVLSGDPPVGLTSLEKTGSGTWTLSSNNTYTGATTVTAGTLLVNGSTTASSTVNVNGGTLGGTGTVGGGVTVNSGGLAPGASAGVLTIGGDLDISGVAGDETGALVFELGPIGSSDRVNVIGALDIGTELLRFSDFTFSPLTGLENGTYTLISSSSLTTSLDTTPANLTGTVGTGTGTIAISGNNLVLQVSGISGGPTDPYDIWANGGELFGDDANGDGVSNGLAFLLGASGPNENALGLLPAVTETAGGLVMTFSMLDSASRGTAALSVEHSGDLGIGDPWEAASVPDSDNTVNDVVFDIEGSGTLDVEATIPLGKAVDGKLFGRLRAENP